MEREIMTSDQELTDSVAVSRRVAVSSRRDRRVASRSPYRGRDDRDATFGHGAENREKIEIGQDTCPNRKRIAKRDWQAPLDRGDSK